MTHLDENTLELATSAAPEQERRMLGLTILLHPDVTRIGEVAPLFSAIAGGRAEVNRLGPGFGAAANGPRRPLESPLVSRQPIVIRTDESGACVIEDPSNPRFLLEGRPLTSAARVEQQALSAGVELELGGSVLLLLHYLSLEAEPAGQLGLLGYSSGVKALRSAILQVADSSTPVLIRGESGPGKELAAHAVHAHSSRRSGPFIAVNAAAIPREMAAGALFGHTRGAFTGAAAASRGYFGQADGGSLFLDEIGELSRDLQGLLLRATREGEIQPLGESRPKKVDVRLITATDANLQELVESGRFSMPLLRRIEAFTLELPPLRERRDDIARLFVHFLRSELSALNEVDKLSAGSKTEKAWLPRQLMRALLCYTWPGNVAELQTVARHVAISNRGRPKFESTAWLRERLAWSPSSAPPPAQVGGAKASVDPLFPAEEVRGSSKTDARSLADAQIVAAMIESRFRVARAAEQLGVSRSWLHTRIEYCEGLKQAKELTADEILAAARVAGDALPGLAEHLRVSEHGLKLRLSALQLTLGHPRAK